METQKNTAENAVKPAKKIRRHIKVIPRKRKRIGASNTAYNIKMANEKNRGKMEEMIESGKRFVESGEENVEVELNNRLGGMYIPSLSVSAKKAEMLIDKDDEEKLGLISKEIDNDGLNNDGLYGEKGVLKEEVFGDFGFYITDDSRFSRKEESLSDGTFEMETGKKIVRPRLTF